MSSSTATKREREGPARSATDAVRKRARSPTDSRSACLVVSGELTSLDVLAGAARQAGWVTAECRSPEEAVRQVVLHDFALALLDLTAGQGREAFGDLLRTLRGSASNLVVICDRDAADPAGELWSREQGAWLYLPEVGEQSGLTQICREAHRVLEKIRGPMVASG
ncbi:MAG: hypothetical protein AAGF31_11600 [Planctomycetota bacterium]